MRYLTIHTTGVLQRLLLLIGLMPGISGVSASEELMIEVLDHEFTVERFTVDKGAPENGDDSGHLILWIAPGFDNDERIHALSNKLVKKGIELWRVDLLENLFIPTSTTAMRQLDGKYVAAIIEQANRITGKKITLMTRAYGALPALRGARLWQQQLAIGDTPYLTGAILFSPEFFSEIPSLGLDPVYHPVVSATNIPIMFYQAGKRGNRWQLDNTLERLEQGGAAVYLKVLPGVTGVFYNEDMATETFEVLKKLPDDLPRIIRMLDRLPTPERALPMAELQSQPGSGLDHGLKPYKGDAQPKAIDLLSSSGEQVEIDDFRGRVTVVNFWASWCRPCVEEIPSLNRLRARMSGKAFELISVNYAESRAQVNEFLTMVDVDYPVLMDEDGRYTASWKVLVYPSTFIISPEGRIMYGVNGAIEWDSDEIIDTLQGLLEE